MIINDEPLEKEIKEYLKTVVDPTSQISFEYN